MASVARSAPTVLVVVLLVTSTFTSIPVTAGSFGGSSPPAADVSADGPPTASSGSDSPSRDGSETLNSNASALDHRVRALNLLASADVPGKEGGERKRQRLQARLNQTFQQYLGLHRVNDSAVFAADRKVAAATHAHAPNVSRHLVAADATLAQTAVADAERGLARLEARNRSVDTAQIRTHLQKARRAVQQAERLWDAAPNKNARAGDGKDKRKTDGKSRNNGETAGNGNQGGSSPAAVITHYRRAWTHAQHALDLLDREVSPTVTITKRADPVHNGTTNYTVQGTVFDVRTHAVELTVSVNGEARTTRLVANATPATTGQFGLVVRLDQPVNEITVTATDPGEPFSRLSDGWQAQLVEATLRLDGDGLPDRYERNTTATDPLDPDSDSTATPSDEADDGVRDGRQDFDSDGLTTSRERTLGTDPLATDTDDDDLTDAYEVRVTATDPLVADTDDDGTLDGAEDPDADGLTNAAEAQFGSNPGIADSDADGLDDATEQANETAPLDPDTDADGLQDGTEFEDPFHTDPLDPDTDGDGTLDGNETYATETANESMGAAVSLTGEGNVAGGVRVTNGSRPRFDGTAVDTARAGPVVSVGAHREFESANLSLTYEESEVEDESALSVFTFDESLGIFVPVASTVDPANDTVTAETTHFSTFTVMSLDGWASQFEPLPSKWTVDEGFASLAAWACTGNCRTKAGTAVVQSQAPSEDDGDDPGGDPGDEPGDDPGDGDPCTSENIGQPPGGGCPPPDDDPCTSDNVGQPPGGCSLNASANTTGDGTLEPADNTGGDSGGTVTASTLSRTVAVPAGAETVRVVVSATVTADGPNATARVVASGTHGSVTLLPASSGPSPTATAAGGSFTTVRESVSGIVGDSLTITATTANNATVRLDSVRVVVDRDGDGLADPVEGVDCLQTAAGCVDPDPTARDTDGDGLPDGRELGQRVHQTIAGHEISYYDLTSKPDEVDSDGDGIDDPTEVFGWPVNITRTANGEPLRWKPSSPERMLVRSDPLAMHSDDDGLDDWVEKEELHTDPQEAVTYAVTERHQRQVVDDFYERWQRHRAEDRYVAAMHVTESAAAMGLLDGGASAGRLGDLTLTDATGDFDFVMTDSGEYVFRALDHRQRTDVWLSNQRELGVTDPWDPDTDDDGLTDGQEVEGPTVVDSAYPGGTEMRTIQPDLATTYHTSPTDPDTDGDGYWDGWLGVYNASNSTNVVLYMEHLTDDDDNNGRTHDDGLAPGERVPAQAGIHNVSRVPSAMGADVDRDDAREHANIHLGELHWETDPAGGSTPSPTLTLEVDYYNGTDYEPLNTESWEEGVEGNYALYGISVTVIRDDVFTDADLPLCEWVPDVVACINPDDGWSYPEIINTTSVVGDEPSDENVYVVNEGDGLLSDSQTGVNLRAPFSVEALFIRGLSAEADDVDQDRFKQSPYDTRVAYVAALTQIHEAAHAMNIGEADDRLVPGKIMDNGEVYSGEDEGTDGVKDRTPEAVDGFVEWSVMASGFARADTDPMTGRYFAFSIEELSTVEA